MNKNCLKLLQLLCVLAYCYGPARAWANGLNCSKIHPDLIQQLAELRVGLDLKLAAGENGPLITKLNREFEKKWAQVSHELGEAEAMKQIQNQISQIQNRQSEVKSIENQIRYEQEKILVMQELLHQDAMRIISRNGSEDHPQMIKDFELKFLSLKEPMQKMVADEVARWANSEDSFYRVFYTDQARKIRPLMEQIVKSENFQVNQFMNFSGDQLTLLSIAARYNDTNLIRLLLDHKDIDVNAAINLSMLTPLGQAIQRKNIEAFYVLAKDPRMKNLLRGSKNATALGVAVGTKDAAMVQAVLDSGISNVNENNGYALRVAVREEYIDVLKVLVKVKGIDLNIDNSSAMKNAIYKKNKEMQNILREAGAKYNSLWNITEKKYFWSDR